MSVNLDELVIGPGPMNLPVVQEIVSVDGANENVTMSVRYRVMDEHGNNPTTKRVEASMSIGIARALAGRLNHAATQAEIKTG